MPKRCWCCAAALTGRWQETMEKVQEAMASDRRRDWQWEAPAGGGVELGCADQAAMPHLNAAYQNEMIAA